MPHTRAQTDRKSDAGVSKAVEHFHPLEGTRNYAVTLAHEQGVWKLRTSRRVLGDVSPSELEAADRILRDAYQALLVLKTSSDARATEHDAYADGDTDYNSDCSTASTLGQTRRHDQSTGFARYRRAPKMINAGPSSVDYKYEVEQSSSSLNGAQICRASQCLVTEEPKRRYIKPQPPIKKKVLYIGDYAEVTRFYESRLDGMQQLALKKIAKAWIKGICPRKQATFPYQDNNRRKEGVQQPKVPGWWPATEMCPFREPDHIKKEERTHLIIHLLRLRLTQQQLDDYNAVPDKDGHTSKPSQVIGESWTKFLQRLAPDIIFEDMPDIGDNTVKKSFRVKLLSDFYDVADFEENRYVHVVTEPETFQYDEDEKRAKKRPFLAAPEESTADNDADAEESRLTPLVVTLPVSKANGGSKRVRRDSGSGSIARPSISVEEMSDVNLGDVENGSMLDNIDRSFAVPVPKAREMLDPSVQKNLGPQTLTQGQALDRYGAENNTSVHTGWRPATTRPWTPHQHDAPVPTAPATQVWSTNTSFNTSFDGSEPSQYDYHDSYQAPFESDFPGKHDYRFRGQYPPHSQQPVQVNHVQIPQQHFAGTPVMSAVDTLSLPFGGHTAQTQQQDMRVFTQDPPQASNIVSAYPEQFGAVFEDQIMIGEHQHRHGGQFQTDGYDAQPPMFAHDVRQLGGLPVGPLPSLPQQQQQHYHRHGHLIYSSEHHSGNVGMRAA